MGRAFSLITVILVVAIGGYIYTKQLDTVSTDGATPQTTIDVTAVRNDLIAIANAERRYWAINSRYASLDELQTDGDIEVPSRQNYSYSAETSDAGFRIIAIYSGSDPNAPQRISIDNDMAMTTE